MSALCGKRSIGALGFCSVLILVFSIFSPASLVAQSFNWKQMNVVEGYDPTPFDIVQRGTLCYGIRGSSVVRSSDSAKTWEIVKTFRTSSIRLKASPDYYFVSVFDTELFRWSDRDTSLVRISDNLPYQTASRLTVQGSLLYAMSGIGLYLSTNSGDTWTQLPYQETGVYALAAVHDALFVMTNYSLYCSLDSGKTFHLALSGLYSVGSHLTFFQSGSDIYCMGGGFKIGRLINRLQRSNYSWSVVPMPELEKDPFAAALYYDQRMFEIKGRLFLKLTAQSSSANYDVPFIAYSDDQGRSWHKLKTPVLQSPTTHVLTTIDSALILCSASEYHVSTDRGLSWAQKYSTLSQSNASIQNLSIVNNTGLFSALVGNGMHINRGFTLGASLTFNGWFPRVNYPGQLPIVGAYYSVSADQKGRLDICDTSGQMYTCLGFDPNSGSLPATAVWSNKDIGGVATCFKALNNPTAYGNPTRFFVGSVGKLFVSYDSMRTWMTYEFSDPSIRVNDVAEMRVIANSKFAYYYFLATNKGVYISLDQAQNWQRAGLGNYEVLCLASNQSQNGYQIGVLAGTSNGVYRLGMMTNDHWDHLGLPGMRIRSIAQSDYSRVIQAAVQDSGLYVSQWDLPVWKDYSAGLANRNVNSIRTGLFNGRHYIFVSNDSGGVSFAEMTHKEVPTSGGTSVGTELDEIENVWPQPASDVVTISMKPSPAIRRLRICSIVGEILQQIDIPAGIDQVSIRTTQLPSANYLIQIHSETGSTTQRVSVLH